MLTIKATNENKKIIKNWIFIWYIKKLFTFVLNLKPDNEQNFNTYYYPRPFNYRQSMIRE